MTRDQINLAIALWVFGWQFNGEHWVTPDGCLMPKIPDFLKVLKPDQYQSVDGESPITHDCPLPI